MANCKQQQEKIEETVLQPMDQWVQKQEQQCKNEPCKWWMLCLNKLICWIVWAAVKITVWVTAIAVRWVYRTVCTLVSLVVGLVALIFGNVEIIKQALSDLWELAKDAFYTSVGAVIYGAIYIVDGIQSILGIQKKKRKLTERERGVLWKVFRNSLNYNAISIVDGNAGLLGVSGRAFTMGFNIYMPSYSDTTLVHECVHVWQFQFEGTKYIGNSALNQFDSMFISKGYTPYSWVDAINAGNSWYTLKSVEAQAQCIEDVFSDGEFVYYDPALLADTTPGAFFKEDSRTGHNEFEYGGDNYTRMANEAWRIIRTG
jgi:hypothetical protein